MYNHSKSIEAGRFNEDFDFFVFIDNTGNLYLLRDYSHIVKIALIPPSTLIFFSCDENRVALKEYSEDFTLISLKRKKILRSMNKIRKLDQSLAYPICTIIVSCFHDSMYLNYV